MTAYIALLRGINVGGHNIIKMADLKNLLEKNGLHHVKTYIQSGNVLFHSEEATEVLNRRLEAEIESVFGFRVPVILRTASEWEQIIASCPFSFDTLLEGESIHVSFLEGVPSQEGLNQLHIFKSDIDEFKIEGKNIYLYFRQSIRKSKLAVHLQKIGVQGTVRNWKTVMKLAAMAEEVR
ncbi:DUF1697 domain-containing protein [Bacillus sp. CGMCC 1.16607]|uniref:DUF1697 domain-containing protein n=1 Tax=Bacillus sp. CGMCC 1.16607 TaxID=3351842 RepID=UPI00363A4A60